MKPFALRRVILSQEACRQMEGYVADTGNLCEAGGLLLGHRVLHRYLVVAVTGPGEGGVRSNVSFVLDGNEHMALAATLAQRFCCEPSVLGVWHSHICDIPSFSQQDRASNRQIAVVLHGALSLLAIASGPAGRLRLQTCFISPGGKETGCSTVVDEEGQRIPHRYMERKKTVISK